MRSLIHGRQGIENVLPVNSILPESVDGEVTDPQGCQILEEMCTLAGIHLKIVQPSFHYHLRGTNVRPLDWYTKPGVAAAPSARPYQEVGRCLRAYLPIGIGRCALGQEITVHSLYLLCYGWVLRGRVPIGLHVHHVGDVHDDPIPDGIM